MTDQTDRTPPVEDDDQRMEPSPLEARTPCAASVRAVVEFALLSGSLLPGSSLARMREGTLSHQARQRAMPEAKAEVTVRGVVLSEVATLTVNGRIDLLYDREGLPVVEEIKLAPAGDVPVAPAPVHRAQAVCYGCLLSVEMAVIRVVYVRRDGTEAAAFEEMMTQEQMAQAFAAFTAPYLKMLDERFRWRAVRDASIRALPFPFDGYRAGQREMAVHAYLAIKQKRRLFAQAPTGTGKTAAVLFPALKALGEGLTGQIYYLTARTTALGNATAALQRMRDRGLRLRALTLTAREKVCPPAQDAPPGERRCNLLECPLAIGFFDRLQGALSDMRLLSDWSREAVSAVAARHSLCPFEFALCLCEEADAVLCDYNYAFDPAVRLRRIFLFTNNVTLLCDEAHNLPDRARSMLSATLESEPLREIRRGLAKFSGRKTELYRCLTELIKWLSLREAGTTPDLPEALPPLLTKLMDEAMAVIGEAPLMELPRTLIAALSTAERFDERYAVLTEKAGKRTQLTLYCLDPAPHLRESTRKLSGTVFFSATLTPLSAFREAIGGTEADGLLSLPSPFPKENLLVMRRAVSTRFKARERTCAAVADAILAAVSAKPGNYLACFPSYAYLARVRDEIAARETNITLHVQRSGMDESAREVFLSAFTPRETGVLLGMVVMGGVFSEGVDLPGDRLSGVAIVGVCLPMICPERELLREYYQRVFSDGFAYAYRYPGMIKVVQAVGRTIRAETDRGFALLIDDRFFEDAYAQLLPHWWEDAVGVKSAAEIKRRTEAFWCGCSM